MDGLRSIYTFLQAITTERERYTMGEALHNASLYSRDLEEVKHMQKRRCFATPLYVAKTIGCLGEMND